MSQIEAKGAVVLGISPDSSQVQKRFSQKHDLPFHLLADEEKYAANLYGVWQEKRNFGRTYMGIVRSTFLIDEKGRITHVFPKVKIKGHAEEVLEKL